MVAARRSRGLWILLGVLTVLALSPGGAPQAVDARTGTPLPGVHLELPASAVWLEPLAAPLHVIAGSPDYRTVGGWALVWVAVAAGLAGWRRGGPGAAIRALLWAIGLPLGFLYWLAAGLFLPVPGWRLVVDDPGWVVADLHSHTLVSHDGLISAADNLATHAAHGYDVVAVTDHKYPEGGDKALALASARGLQVLAGIEVRSPLSPYLLGIGLHSGIPVVRRHGKDRDGQFERRFINNVHRDHGGVVLALSHRLNVEDVVRLADEGVDGFELANFGHPAPSEAVDRAIRDVARDRSLLLVASSDWHGWGAFFRTWTLVRSPAGWKDPAGAVLDALRTHRTRAVVPVTAGTMGSLTAWQAVMSPVVGAVRYARSLSAARLGVWWLWGLGAWCLMVGCRRWVLRPGRLAWALGLTTGSVSLLWRAEELLLTARAGAATRPFPLAVGWEIFAAAVAGLIVATFLASRARATVRVGDEVKGLLPSRLAENLGRIPS